MRTTPAVAALALPAAGPRRTGRCASGRESVWFIVGFAPRKTLHRTGTSCVYLERLDDVDREASGDPITRCVRHVRQVGQDAGGVPRTSEMPPPPS